MISIMTSMSIGPSVSGKDLSDPAMTLENNPLARGAAATRVSMIEERNMCRLHKDARLRDCPINGHVYAGIMDNRYGG